MNAENVRYGSPKPVITPADSRDLAWAAGFFDGEGHAFFTPRVDLRRNRIYAALGLVVTQAETETLYRFRDAVGCGTILGPYPNREHRPNFRWRVGSFEDTQAVIAMIWNFLSPPKRQQARAVLVSARAWRLDHPDRRKKASA